MNITLTPRQRAFRMSGRALEEPVRENLQNMIKNANATIAEGFKGVTTDGNVIPGLYPIRQTGVSTAPLVAAAKAFLASLSPEDQAKARFPLETDVWQRWSNVHMYTMRHGAFMETMTDAQKDAVFDLMRASTSEYGFQTSRDIMRLNETILEMTGSTTEYGEWLYWVSVMGEPSETEPWGWQIDGHHLNFNCFVMGDQIVMTPVFWGSEPCWAPTGKYAGTRVFERNETAGEVLMRTLDDGQRGKAILTTEKLKDMLASGAFEDNVILPYEGLLAADMTGGQRDMLTEIVASFVDMMPEGHARIRMEEIKDRLNETYFAWIGQYGEGDAFYYRVQSPVVLIEFDHQRGVAFENDLPNRQHIHTMIRTPNGNDYGKDLLRQHYQQHPH